MREQKPDAVGFCSFNVYKEVKRNDTLWLV